MRRIPQNSHGPPWAILTTPFFGCCLRLFGANQWQMRLQVSRTFQDKRYGVLPGPTILACLLSQLSIVTSWFWMGPILRVDCPATHSSLLTNLWTVWTTANFDWTIRNSYECLWTRPMRQIHEIRRRFPCYQCQLNDLRRTEWQTTTTLGSIVNRLTRAPVRLTDCEWPLSDHWSGHSNKNDHSLDMKARLIVTGSDVSACSSGHSTSNWSVVSWGRDRQVNFYEDSIDLKLFGRRRYLSSSWFDAEW